MNLLKLSNKGNELIKLYEQMAAEGFDRQDGSRTPKDNAYNSFQLNKFRNVCRAPTIDHKTKTVLDYGAGGSDWDAPNFDPITGDSAKKNF